VDEQPISDYGYQQYLEEEKLMGSRCTACGALYVPPRGRCSACQQAQMEWQQMQGTGKLAAFTCIAIGPPFMTEQGFDRNNPYCSAVIELAEGPRVVARVEGVDARQPEEIQVGMRLVARFAQRAVGDDVTTSLTFAPV
jgi:uncharacterized OB-fold protein